MMLYIVMGLCAVLGFWVVWAFMDRPRGGKHADAVPPEPARPWREVLGVAPDASSEAVHAAYLREMEDYRPERVASLAAEFRALAERRCSEIERAYREALSVTAGLR